MKTIDFLPLKRMWDSVENAKQDSDTAYFMSLMNYGEMLVKIYASGLIAGVKNDKQRLKYRLEYEIVRASGLGKWVESINEVLIGPTAELLSSEMTLAQSELLNTVKGDDWQYDATKLLYECLKFLDKTNKQFPPQLQGKSWFEYFRKLRNATNHGAPPPSKCSKIARKLSKSLIKITENLSLIKLPWAYIRQNLSASYRVTKWNTSAKSLSILSTKKNENHLFLKEGIYINNKLDENLADNYYPVPLIHSDPESKDFMCMNGSLANNTYEVYSYITGDRKRIKNNYKTSPGGLPCSETEGLTELDAIGKSFSNMPSFKNLYIHRNELENKLIDLLCNDRHPVITLHGRGGIGKTALALSTLHKIAKKGHFDAIIWFSARDIDLFESGPKAVQAKVLSELDMGKEFTNLVQPKGYTNKKFDHKTYLQENLTKSIDFSSILFVLDNFETVKNIAELYEWLDTFIRLPNKVLITTRIRSFRGDYPIEISGMYNSEANELINKTAEQLSIKQLLNREFINNLIDESGGHPYIIKILLGEIKKEGKVHKIERIVATQDKVLDALFERTYKTLSSAAERVFLTLSAWRSTLPMSAVRIVFLRESMEKFDFDAAINELNYISFVEIIESEKDKSEFLEIPLAASIFGRRKLQGSPLKASIEADIKILHLFGPGKTGQIKEGLYPRIKTFLNTISGERQEQKENKLHLFILEHLGKIHQYYLPMIAEYFKEIHDIDKAIECNRLFVESPEGTEEMKRYAWQELTNLYHGDQNFQGEANAYVEQALVPSTSIEVISSCSNSFNALLSRKNVSLDSDEKLHLAQKLVEVFESKLDNANSNDYSRLAWLCLHCKVEGKAKSYAEKGLMLDENNYYCKSLINRFK